MILAIVQAMIPKVVLKQHKLQAVHNLVRRLLPRERVPGATAQIGLLAYLDSLDTLTLLKEFEPLAKPRREQIIDLLKRVPPRAGKNARGNSEWLLPDPPIGKEHRYVFQLFALDLPMTLMPGASREDVEASIEGHITACAVLTGRFEGHEREKLDLEEDLGIDPDDLDLD